MSEIQYVMVGGNEHLGDLKCVPRHESSSSLNHGNLKRNKKYKNTRVLHWPVARALSVQDITPLTLLNRVLNDLKKKSKEKNHISTLQNRHILPEPGQDPTFESGNSFINPTSASRAGGWAGGRCGMAGALGNRQHPGGWIQRGERQPRAAHSHLILQAAAACIPPGWFLSGELRARRNLQPLPAEQLVWFTSLCQAARCLSKTFLQAESHHYLQPLETGFHAAFKASGSHISARTCAPSSQPSLPSLLTSPQVYSPFISWLILGLSAPAVPQTTARAEQQLRVAQSRDQTTPENLRSG